MKNLSKSVNILFFSLFSFAILALPVHGAIGSLQELTVFIFNSIGSLTRIVVILGTVFFFWGMALFILHAENEDEREEGKKKMLWGIITLAVMFGIWGIVRLLQSFILGSGLQTSTPGF